MTESGDKNIYAYLTICLSIAVFICAVIIVVLILRVKRMQAENERQNSSEDNYNRRRLQTSTLDKRLEEETYENPGMSTEDVTDNQEHYEVLELREGDEKTSRAGENGKEFYVNTDIRN
ncbi:uncharacterized protein LOC123540639 [Mercenaria mercenaria]|uniref:uncharacterized protein LOC123540639 n=1 Tax=Mercenaria mercenaria TaxID=6596 RepID=UPI00234E4992|nr:uncharacterized protein LOC123540639 [Mercenaria mercenaria]